MTEPAPVVKKDRHIFRWVFLAVQLVFLAWIIGGVSSGPECAPGPDFDTCQAASGIGAGIGVALIIALWLAVDFILAITYLIFRKK